MKLRRNAQNAVNLPAKSGRIPSVNPRVEIVDRAIALMDFVSRNVKDDEAQQEAVEVKRILGQRKQELEAA